MLQVCLSTLLENCHAHDVFIFFYLVLPISSDTLKLAFSSN